MKGLELCRDYYFEVGRPAIEHSCPELLGRMAAGLVGEGSECLGFDDELSRDHDWGPGFCIWLNREDMPSLGETAKAIYASLPRFFKGNTRLNTDSLSHGRVGVMSVEDFYFRFLGRFSAPEKPVQWLVIPEEYLALAVNG